MKRKNKTKMRPKKFMELEKRVWRSATLKKIYYLSYFKSEHTF